MYVGGRRWNLFGGFQRRCGCRLLGGAGESRRRRLLRGDRIMFAKSFVMLVLATVLGPAVGVGLFVLLHTL